MAETKLEIVINDYLDDHHLSDVIAGLHGKLQDQGIKKHEYSIQVVTNDPTEDHTHIGPELVGKSEAQQKEVLIAHLEASHFVKLAIRRKGLLEIPLKECGLSELIQMHREVHG